MTPLTLPGLTMEVFLPNIATPPGHRYATRRLLRQRGTSIIEARTVALGIRASTAIFSIIDKPFGAGGCRLHNGPGSWGCADARDKYYL